MLISVDFDDTLEVFPNNSSGGIWDWDRSVKVPNWPLIHKLQFLAEQGNVLILTTSRKLVHLQECIEFCKWVKLPITEFNTTGDSHQMKADFLRLKSIDFHLDDDSWEIQHCDLLGVKAFHWKNWLKKSI